MAGTSASGKGGDKTPSREDRLKSALKANLARRKAQARARAEAQSHQQTQSDQQAQTSGEDEQTDG